MAHESRDLSQADTKITLVKENVCYIFITAPLNLHIGFKAVWLNDKESGHTTFENLTLKTRTQNTKDPTVQCESFGSTWWHFFLSLCFCYPYALLFWPKMTNFIAKDKLINGKFVVLVMIPK